MIKKSIITQLRANLGEFDGIYFEEVLDTDDNGTLNLSGSYIFVDMMPSQFETVSGSMSKIRILVDVVVHTQKELNREYMDITMRLDDVFRPAFAFGDMVITVHGATARIVDRVLHYGFGIEFYYSKDSEQTLPLMSNLETRIKGE